MQKKRSEKVDFTTKQRVLPEKGKTVYIGNLSYRVDENELFRMLSKFGKVTHVSIVKKDGQSKGMGFVDMFKAADADEAIKSLNGKIVGGRTLKASEANNRPEFKTASVKPRKTIEPVESFNPKKKRVKKVKGLDLLFKNTGRS